VAELVSVLMATYNGERFLVDQIESILGQDHDELELIAIDDGSVDGTSAILAEYKARDRRISLIDSTGNRGQKQRLAELLTLARGQYISIADQDDVWAPEKTRKLLSAIGDAGLAFGRSELVDEDDSPLGTTLLAGLRVTPAPDDRLVALFRPAVSGHAMLAYREMVTDAAFRRAHPYDWLIGIEALFAKGWRYTDEAVVRHRIHGGNQSNASIIRRTTARPPFAVRLFRESRKLLHPGRGSWQWFKRQRFVLRLEHLGHSPLVPADFARGCLRLRDACTNAWYGEGAYGAVRRRDLKGLMEELLQPYAGSHRDRVEAEREFSRLA